MPSATGSETTDGVLVTSVRPGGPAGASKPQIQRNDVLVSVGGEPIKNSPGASLTNFMPRELVRTSGSAA